MSRKYKVRDNRAPYFVTFTIVEWFDVFTRNIYRDIMIESFKYCQKNKGLIIYAYCIMTNHVHMIISVKDDHLIPDVVRDLKKFTSIKILEEIKSSGRESRKDLMLNTFRRSGRKNSNNQRYQLWQQHYHPIELGTNQIMDQKLDYLHNNPVVAGFVNDPIAWIFSSAGSYAGRPGLIDVEFIG